jgi:hypothetical protein
MPVSTVCIHDPVGEACPAADRTDAVRVVDAAAPPAATLSQAAAATVEAFG